MWKRFVVLTFLVLNASSCRSVYDLMSSTKGSNPTNWNFEYSASGCFGQCPQFTAVLDYEGNLSFLGRRFTSFDGDTTIAFNTALRDSLIVRLEALKFMDLDTFYGDPYIQDIPEYRFKLSIEETSKTVLAKSEIPADLQEFREWFNKNLSLLGLL